jgi:hypothetical protein
MVVVMVGRLVGRKSRGTTGYGILQVYRGESSFGFLKVTIFRDGKLDHTI